MNGLKSGAEMAIVFVFLGPLHLAVSIYNWFSISTNLLSSVQKVDEIKFLQKTQVTPLSTLGRLCQCWRI